MPWSLIRRNLCVLAFAALSLAPRPAAADCRFVLADQSNWNARLGYSLSLESQSGASAPCALASLKLVLTSADGKQWRSASFGVTWQLDNEYTAAASIAPDSARLLLNGKVVGTILGSTALDPASPPLTAGALNGSTGYIVIEQGISVTTAGGNSANLAFDETAALPKPLLLLLSPLTQSIVNPAASGESFTVAVRFRITARPDPRVLDPWVDRYGQLRHSDWPGKVKSDADLASSAQAERLRLQQWGLPGGLDAFGGMTNAGWKEAPMGFFRVARRGGMWWLITPAGNPCFYIGLGAAPSPDWHRTPVTGRSSMFEELPPRTGPYADAWGVNSWGQSDGTEDVAFIAANLIRKYDAGWRDKAIAGTVERLRAWGFSGLGKWSADAGGLALVPVLTHRDVPSLISHPDVFDPAIQGRLRQSLSLQISPRKKDPLVLGWSVGNELGVIVTADETSAVLKTASPAKRAMVDQSLAKTYGGNVSAMAAAWGVQAATAGDLYAAAPTPPPADIEALRQFYQGQYYAFLYRTVKEIDPDHLYLGCWIVPGWWVNEDDWRMAAASADVVGLNSYGATFPDPRYDLLIRQTDKPVFIGEFAFPPTYGFQRGFGAYPPVRADDDAGAGKLYEAWMDGARQHPNVVGVSWLQYRDEPFTGRGPGQGPGLVYGDNYALGLVDVADQPKYDLVGKVRTANLAAAAARAALSGLQPSALPAVNDGGVVNAAGYGAAPVAPGSLISIFGANLATAAAPAATVQMGAVSAPVLFASALQINVQVPWELAGQTQAPLTIAAAGITGSTAFVSLAAYAPGIFLVGATQGAILAVPGNGLAAPSGTVPGARPARRNEYLSIYCTGLGPVQNQPATGQPAPLSPLATTLAPVSVVIGGIEQPASWSGLAPGFVGLYQVNVQVPSGVASGGAVPLFIQIAGVRSNLATVAVEPD